MKSREFYKLQKKWYKRLEREGFHDIEGGNEHAHTLQQHGGGANSVTGLNAVHAASGRPMHQTDAAQGSEWEELISDQDRNVDMRGASRGVYYHYAQLIAAQEYELRRLGNFMTGIRMRRTWSLHAQSVGEREIARMCGTSRHEIRKYIKQLDELVHAAIDIADEV